MRSDRVSHKIPSEKGSQQLTVNWIFKRLQARVQSGDLYTMKMFYIQTLIVKMNTNIVLVSKTKLEPYCHFID